MVSKGYPLEMSPAHCATHPYAHHRWHVACHLGIQHWLSLGYADRIREFVVRDP